MSRKSQRNRPDVDVPKPDGSAADEARRTRRMIAVAVAALFVLAIGVIVFAARNTGAPAPVADAQADAARVAALASEHAMSIGDPNAKVHVVEFLDPACETCALFFPIVKEYIAANPGRIRLSVRHVAFHQGADYAVRVIEASRAQDKYWQTLETLLGTQGVWAPNHTVQPELVDRAIAGVGLDAARLASDASSPEVAQRIAKDRADAMTLQVTATPEYFVNGRGLPSFGEAQLRQLIREELQKAYP